MNDSVVAAAISLLNREKPRLVAAMGLLFEKLGRLYENYPVRKIAEDRGGVWGEEAFPGYGYPILRSTNMRGVRVDVDDVAWRDVPAKQAEGCILQTGDILITKSSGSSDLVGKAAIFTHPGDDRTYLFSNFTLRLRPNHNKIVPEFLAWFLRSPQSLMWRYETQHTTVGLRNLKTRDFLGQQVPLPDLDTQAAVVAYLNALENDQSDFQHLPLLPPFLAEQRRIVARIESLAAKVEAARKLREETLNEIDHLFYCEVRAIYEELIKMYGSTRLNNLIATANYGTSKKCQPERLMNLVPVLRIPNIISGKISFEDMKYAILDEKELPRVLLNEGDVLIVRTNGSADLVGRSAVVDMLSEPSAFASYLIRIKCASQVIIPDYMQEMLNYLRLDGQLFDFARTTAGQYNVSLGRLRSAQIPVPPLPEQHRIVAHLDALQARLALVQQHQTATQARLAALLPSLLDRAFKGEL